MRVNIYNCLDLLRDSLFHNKIQIHSHNLCLFKNLIDSKILEANNKGKNGDFSDEPLVALCYHLGDPGDFG